MSDNLFQTYGVSSSSSKDLTAATITNANSPYSVPSNVDVVFADATSGAITITMPSATRSSPIYIRKIGTGQNIVTINNIDGGAFLQHCPGEEVQAQSDGSNWQSISKCTDGYFGTITTTGSWVSNATYTGVYWKRGGLLMFAVRVAVTGSPTAANLTITLPNSWAIDATKANLGTGQRTLRGLVLAHDAANVTSYWGTTRVEQSALSTIEIRFGTTVSSELLSTAVSNTNPFNFGNNDYVNIECSYPITGFQE